MASVEQWRHGFDVMGHMSSTSSFISHPLIFWYSRQWLFFLSLLNRSRILSRGWEDDNSLCPQVGLAEGGHINLRDSANW